MKNFDHCQLCFDLRVCVKEEEKEREREGKADRVSELKKDYTVSITCFAVVGLCCVYYA